MVLEGRSFIKSTKCGYKNTLEEKAITPQRTELFRAISYYDGIQMANMGNTEPLVDYDKSRMPSGELVQGSLEVAA